jgi:hypothetical protein
MSELLTVAEVALVLKCSEDAVVRRFVHVDGVIDLGQAATRDKRRYRVLRVPKAVLEKYLSKKAGHPVHVTIPDRPERRRKSVNWEDKAVLNLAKAALQNGCTDKAVLRRISDKARVFTRIPESMWSEAISSWSDVEEET